MDHAQAAGILSNVSGRMIGYQAITEQAMIEGARESGMPEDAVQYMALLYDAVRNGWMAPVTQDVEKATGKAPLTFAEFARGNTDVGR